MNVLPVYIDLVRRLTYPDGYTSGPIRTRQGKDRQRTNRRATP